MYEAGFDLTDFKSKEDFLMILSILELGNTPRRDEDACGFIFEGEEGNYLVTGSNPITGTMYNGQKRNEEAYASYIGIQGSKDWVRRAFNLINDTADFIKDSNATEREFI
jgi:hypothetical protein